MTADLVSASQLHEEGLSITHGKLFKMQPPWCKRCDKSLKLHDLRVNSVGLLSAPALLTGGRKYKNILAA